MVYISALWSISHVGQCLWAVLRYLSRELIARIHSVSGTGVGSAGRGFSCAAVSLDELEEVLLKGALVAGGPKLRRLGQAAAPELDQFFSDLPVQQAVEERVHCKGGVGQPGDCLLQVPGAVHGASQRHLQVEDEVGQPTNQELTHD